MTIKSINTSNASFENTIKNNCIYVDKTEYLYNLIKGDGQYYFLSRPRRFGKSLTISTLENIFKGKKELFKDLYIGKTDYDFKEYPVIHLDFGACQKETADGTKTWINDSLLEIANEYGITTLREDRDFADNFKFLILALSKQAKVVVLIDEYDKPLTSNYSSKEVEKIRFALRGFYEIIKASYDYIRFVFLTGVTKYSNMGIFSSMNNLLDISMEKQYATMLGFTQDELETNFNCYIEEGLKNTKLSKKEYLQRIKEKYDGYCFYPNTETLYNPVSVSKFFVNGGVVFKNYWAETGGTKIIADVARKVNFDIDNDFDESISTTDINAYDIVDMITSHINKTTYKALLFQAGYLTISSSKDVLGDMLLYLNYPNKEIQEYFSIMLVNNVYSGKDGGADASTAKLTEPLLEGDIPHFIKRLQAIYASVPHTLLNAKVNVEADFHLMFHAMMQAVGANINSEVITNKGRIDSVVELPGHIYIFEFKLDKSSEEALQQIKEKSYYEKYISSSKNKAVHLVGISFSTKERNITDYKEEVL